ncbi:MAG: hypothetical protein WCC04_06440 [Terriglobales bacterium]
MKMRLWQKTLIVAALLTAGAVGQSMRGGQIVQVPFPFVVAERTLPAGRYFVTNIGETRLRIYSAERQSLVQTHTVQGHAPEGSGKMVFHRYGDVYFLAEVWAPGRDVGQQLTKSRAEDEVRKLKATESGIQTAVLRFTSSAN